MPEPVKVLIGMCSYSGPSVHCFDHQFEFMHYLGRLQERSWMQSNGVPTQDSPPLDPFSEEAELREDEPEFRFFTASITKHSLIGQARDTICERAISAGMDYLFFWDDDMIFPRNLFLRLWRHQVPVVAPLMFTAREPIAPVLFQLKRQWNRQLQRSAWRSDPMFRYPKNELFRVDAVGSGILLIDVKALSRMKAPWFHGGIGCGEDFHFCVRCYENAIPVYCDSSIKTSHEPNVPLQWHDEEYYTQKVEDAERAYEAQFDHCDTDVQQPAAAL